MCVLDTETTGTDPESDRIVEIWIGRYEGFRLRDEFHYLVNPRREIPFEAQDIHGITDRMVRDKPTFKKISRELKQFVRTDLIVTHSLAGFDMRIINSELSRAGMTRLSNPSIDTLSLARRQFRFKRRFNRLKNEYERNCLTNVVRELGLRNVPRHRAKSDGKATAAAFFKMIRIFEKEWELSVADVDDLQNKIRTPSAKRVKKNNKMKLRNGEWKTP